MYGGKYSLSLRMATRRSTPPLSSTVATEVSDTPFSTPMMQQYLQLKKQYQECLLFFRLGDFYELFLEDAKIGAQVLGITLTSRARGKDGRIPMAGVPYHAADTYIARLLAAGYKVAICEQLSEATGRTLVDRQVVRVLTPGTITSDQLLPTQDHNYLLGAWWDQKKCALAVCDISTGELRVDAFPAANSTELKQHLEKAITQYQPKECVHAPLDETSPLAMLLAEYQDITSTSFAEWPHKPSAIKQLTQIALSQRPQDAAAASVLAGVLKYLEYTQKVPLQHLSPAQSLYSAQFLQLDQAAIANLELLQTLRAHHSSGSLLQVINLTVTAPGNRLLKQWLLQPSCDLTTIKERQEHVSYWYQAAAHRQEIRVALNTISDNERSLSRLSVGTGTPRDVRSLANSLLATQQLLSQLKPAETAFNQLDEALTPQLRQLAAALDLCLVEQPPIDPKQGGLFKTGHNPTFDELRATIHTHRQALAELENLERQQTAITTLKVRYNQVFGFYIEVSKANAHLVPDRFQRLQTLVNAERYTTPQLKIHEQAILTAQNTLAAQEYALFQQMIADVIAQAGAIQTLAQQLAHLDCVTTLAEVAERYRYSRPTMVAEGELHITQGRHPVLERLTSSLARPFIPNDIRLGNGTPDSPQVMLITGPNMAGKSVLMRQVALIVLLAHIGSFVPADAAQIPITDRIFVRSGAADMITAGLSTFMVEMVETASILHTATPQSLVIMDEIGRGTSTYDGISIAWAVAEYLVSHTQHAGRTLFATHYHELQELSQHWPGKVANYHLAVTQHQGELVFLYQLTAGGSAHSHGLAVAKLAGLPQPVLVRAQSLLQQLESHHSSATITSHPTATKTTPSLVNELKQLDFDELTPLAALNLIATWKKRYG